jgi:hypothetical protein
MWFSYFLLFFAVPSNVEYTFYKEFVHMQNLFIESLLNVHPQTFKHLLFFVCRMKMSVVCYVDATHFIMLLLR